MSSDEKQRLRICMTYACCWHGFEEDLCKAINLQAAQAVADPTGVWKVKGKSSLGMTTVFFGFVFIVFHLWLCNRFRAKYRFDKKCYSQAFK